MFIMRHHGSPKNTTVATSGRRTNFQKHLQILPFDSSHATILESDIGFTQIPPKLYKSTQIVPSQFYYFFI